MDFNLGRVFALGVGAVGTPEVKTLNGFAHKLGTSSVAASPGGQKSL